MSIKRLILLYSVQLGDSKTPSVHEARSHRHRIESVLLISEMHLYLSVLLFTTKNILINISLINEVLPVILVDLLN